MELEKDFSIWMPVKQRIQDKNSRPFYKAGEIWWCSLGTNIGSEMDGKGEEYWRPVLIMKDFNHCVLWCVPLTKQPKEGKYYVSLSLKDGTGGKVILSQLRLIDAKRLRKRLGIISDTSLLKIKQAIVGLLLE